MANYEKFAQLLSERNIKSVDVARATGIYTSTFSDWKTGRRLILKWINYKKLQPISMSRRIFF